MGQRLQRAGFFIHHSTGSHQILKHTARGNEHLRVTVPYHNNDLKRSTLASIIREAGFSIEEFIELM